MSRAAKLRRAPRTAHQLEERRAAARRRRRRVRYRARDCPYCNGPRKLYIHDETHVIVLAQCYDCGADQYWTASGKYIGEFRPNDDLAAKNAARRDAL